MVLFGNMCHVLLGIGMDFKVLNDMSTLSVFKEANYVPVNNIGVVGGRQAP
jgi:hypothetical protein